MSRALTIGSCLVLVLLALPASAADDADLAPADGAGIIIRPKGTTSSVLGFTVWFPPAYRTTSDRFPVVMQFQGTGEQGDGSGATASDQLYDKSTKYGAMKRVRLGTWPHPVIVVSPQCQSGWKSNEINTLVDYMLANWRVDPDRLYFTGLCQGGAGAWQYAQTYPGKVAAIVPIQTSAGPGAPASLVDIPVWAFHSFGDWQFNRRNTINWIDGLLGAVAGVPSSVMATYPNTGGDPAKPAPADMTAHYDAAAGAWTWLTGKPATALPLADATQGVVFTMYQGAHHNTWHDVWDNTPQMWTWLFAQRKPARSAWAPGAATIPGRIQAEHFDRGRGRVVWEDSDRVNRGGALRNEGPDLAVTTDADGGHDLVHTQAGEFLSYSTTVAAQGIYDLYLRVAAATPGRIRILLNGQDISGPLAIPATGGSDTWATVPVLTSTFATGVHDLRLQIEVGGFKLNWFEVGPSTAPAVIVDNTTAERFTTVGTWPAATSIPGYYGPNYAWATASSASSATWTPALPEAGYWQVYLRHPADAARSPAVPVTITSDLGPASASVNQRVEGATWKFLGVYPFTPGAGGNVTISTAGTTGFVVADAVMFVKAYQVPPLELTIDNRDTQRFSTVGTWPTSSSVPGYHAADYAFNNPINQGGLSASFTASLTGEGLFKVYARWAANPNRSAGVPVDVMHRDGTTTVVVNQQQNGGTWNLLGTWYFAPGSATVRIRTDGTTGYVIADAVRFVETDELPPVDLIIDNADPVRVSTTGQWAVSTGVPGFFGTNFLNGNATGVGGLIREVWTDLPGSGVASIPVGTAPSLTGQLGLFEAPPNFGDNYGQRVRGWLVPPTTGTYTFWIASDDDSQLWLSTSADPAAKVLIAHITNNWTMGREWNKFPTQKSAAISLVAGQRYYIEALHREGGGGDHLAVGWARPTQGTSVPSEVIPGTFLSPFGAPTPGTVTWRPNIPKEGIYEVYVQHPANTTRAPSVPITVAHRDGTFSTTIDQRSNGGLWRLLGTFRFASGTAAAVTMSTAGTTGWTAADAVRFKETDILPPRDIIIDNTDPVQTATTGTWALATSATGYWGANYSYNTVLGGGKTFSFIPSLDRDGYFEVSIWHPADANRDKAVQVEVVHADGTYGHFLDLTENGGTWEVLGTFAFLKGTAGRVIVRTDGSSKYVMADAVRFREVEALPDPQPLSLIVDNAWTAFTSATGSWPVGSSVAGYFASNYAYNSAPGVSGSAFTFRPDLPHPGTFNVYIRHSGAANRSVAVPVDVITPDGTVTTLINQRLNNGTWLLLGTFPLPAGTGTSVRVRTDGTSGYVTADAVWFEELILEGSG